MTKQQEVFLTTVSDVVKAILKTMSEKNKSKIKNTSKRDLLKYHNGWGTSIRNQYGLWRGNQLLKKDTGKNHSMDAFIVIIELFGLRCKKI